MDSDDTTTIGYRLRRIRVARGKSLEVIAGLAGITKQYLSLLETGQRSLDSLSLIGRLADALQIAPSELTRLPVPAPANGETDSVVEMVRLALMAAAQGVPGGRVQPVQALRARVTATVDALCRCDHEHEIGAALPALVADLHTTLAAGSDVPELLDLVVWLHTQATVPWLSLAGAPLDLRSQVVLIARQAAEARDTAVPKGLVAAAGARVALAGGAFGVAEAGLDAVDMPTDTTEAMQLAGFLALRRSVVLAADGRLGDVDAPLDYATDLAARTGEGNAYGLGFGPLNVDQYRIAGLLEIGDHEQVVGIAERMNPDAHGNVSRRAAYWADYGRALSQVRGRHADAVMALRRAEAISPHRIQRNPLMRELLVELGTRARRDEVGRELRGMAYRAGLNVT